MIIRGYPVPLRRPLRWLADLLRTNISYSLRRTDASTPAKLHFVYFSYSGDFVPLRLSLISLANHPPPNLASVHVWIDENSPFTESQCRELESVFPDLQYGVTSGFGWASRGTLATELRAFDQIGSRSAENDYVVKTDSDILFHSGIKLEMASKLRADLIGDGHYVGYRHVQGGLYLIRSGFAVRLVSRYATETLEVLINENTTLAEDLIIHKLVDRIGGRIRFTHLMLFPKEFRDPRCINRHTKRHYAALHFSGCKEQMSDYAQILGLPGHHYP